MTRLTDKIAYLFLLVSLNTGYLLINFFRIFHFLLPRKREKNDLILFPYYQEGSIGFTLRFEQYLPYLQRDGLRYKIASLMPDEEYIRLNEKDVKSRYWLYHKILWKRIFQTLAARNYRAAFVQRSLFVGYPDLKEPHLEKLLKKLNDHVVYDYWDAVWLNNEEIFSKIVKHADVLSCVNQYIIDYFRDEKATKVHFPIGMDLSRYRVKDSYQTGKEIRFFYTGQPGNLAMFLKIVIPVLEKLAMKYPLKLVVVSRAKMAAEYIPVEHHFYDPSTFFDIAAGCDIGLFAIENTEVGKGKMAMKVLDYMATGLPSVATPVGLPASARDGKEVFYAFTKKEWEEKIVLLIEDENLRKQMGTAARKAAEKHHNLDSSYRLFREINGL